jgi:hypothetical protein
MSGVPASLRRYRADLVAAIDRELEGARRARARRTRARPWRSRWGALLLATTLVAAAFLALTIVAPWQSSRTILDRAEAALLAPSAGNILYERVTVHPIVFSPRGTVARVQLWVNGARPRRFRMTFGGAWRVELGGILGSSTGLNYVASDQALHQTRFQFRVRQSDLDPAAFIKTALRSGRAKLDGKATIHGRDVIRIQLSAWFDTMDARLLEPIALYYVDAQTYRPVRVVIPPPGGPVVMLAPPSRFDPADFSSLGSLGFLPEDTSTSSRLGFPMDPSAFLLGSPGYSIPTLPVLLGPGQTVSGRSLYRVYDFEDYRLIAPTAANRRLTNLRAMHPRATVPSTG